jgi:hypothetical protein
VNDKWHHFVARGSELEIASTTGIDQSACFVMHPAEFKFASERRPLVETAVAQPSGSR